MFVMKECNYLYAVVQLVLPQTWVLDSGVRTVLYCSTDYAASPFRQIPQHGVSWRWVLKGREDEKRDKLALTDKIIASVQRLTGEGPKTGRLICKGIDEEHRERREDKFDLRELKIN